MSANPTSVSLHAITIPVYIRNLINLKVCLEKTSWQTLTDTTQSQKWCHEQDKPESYLTEASLAPDMKDLPFQIQLCTLMVRSGVFGSNWAFHSPADEPEYAQDFPGMISRIQKTIDFLQAIKPGDVGDAELRPYYYWPSGKENVGDPIVFASASNLVMQYVYPNFFFHMTTAYDICRHKGVPLSKMDFLLSAGMFS